MWACLGGVRCGVHCCILNSGSSRRDKNSGAGLSLGRNSWTWLSRNIVASLSLGPGRGGF